jgi:hypothetical protein
MLDKLKEKLSSTQERNEIREIMCGFFSAHCPKLINGKPVINYSILKDRVEIDSDAHFELLTIEDVTNAVVLEDGTVQVPNPRRLCNQIVNLTF